MKIIYGAGEVPSNRLLLMGAGITNIGINFHNLTLRMPKRKEYVLDERFPAHVKLHVYPGDLTKLTEGEAEDLSEKYQLFISDNIERLTSWTEFDCMVMGPAWVHNQRTMFWDGFEEDGFRPIWHPEHGEDLTTLAQMYPHVAITRPTLDSEQQLDGRATGLHNQYGTQFHALGVQPDLMSKWVASAITTTWTSPMRRGETIIWDTDRLRRYPATMKLEARTRHKNLIEQVGLNWAAIEADDPTEVSRLTLWSFRQLEAQLSHHDDEPQLADNSESEDTTNIVELPTRNVGNKPPEMRQPTTPRPLQEQAILPTFGYTTKEVIEDDVLREVPIITSRSSSLRSCNTCFVAANCPAMKPDAACAFHLPVEVKTKDQLLGLLNAVTEMQAARVAFARFAEELNGGMPDRAVSEEIDRLFRLVKQSKEIQDNREFLRMTVERQTSGGVLSAIFGERAQTLAELPAPLPQSTVDRVLADGPEVIS